MQLARASIGINLKLIKSDSDVNISISSPRSSQISPNSGNASSRLLSSPVSKQVTARRKLREIAESKPIRISISEASPSQLSPQPKPDQVVMGKFLDTLQPVRKITSRLPSTLDLEDKTFDLGKDEDLEIIVDLIQKTYKKRQEVDCLAKYFQVIPFFQDILKDLSQQSFRNLINKMTYRFVPKHTLIFRKGDIGDKFYIILKGKVAITSSKEGLNPDAPVEDSQKRRRNSILATFALPPSKNSGKQTMTDIKITPTKSHISVPNGHKKREYSAERESHNQNLNPGSQAQITGGRTLKPSMQKVGSSGNISPLRRENSAVDISQILKGMSMKNIEDQKKRRGSWVGGERIFERKETEHSRRSSFSQQVEMLKRTESRLEESVDSMLERSFDRFLERDFPTETIAKEIGDGTAFGEFAFIGNNKRTVTTITVEDCHFAMIDRGVFNEILRKYYEGLYKEKISFLQKSYLFHDWSQQKLSALVMLFDTRVLSKGQIVYNFDDTAKSVYFLKSGEVELLETIVYQNEKKTANQLDDLRNKAIQDLRIKTKNNQSVKKVVSRLTPGSLFGEEEAFSGMKRCYMAKVSSLKAELYEVKKEQFFDAIKKSSAFDRIVDQLESKFHWRNDFSKSLTHSMSMMKEANSEISMNPKTTKNLKAELKSINTRFVVSAQNSPRKKDTKRTNIYPHRSLKIQSTLEESELKKQKQQLKESEYKSVHDLEETSKPMKISQAKRSSLTTTRIEEVTSKLDLQKAKTPLDVQDIEQITLSTYERMYRPSPTAPPSSFNPLAFSTYSTPKGNTSIKDMIESQKFFGKEKSTSPSRPTSRPVSGFCSSPQSRVDTPNRGSNKIMNTALSKIFGAIETNSFSPSPMNQMRTPVSQQTSFLSKQRRMHYFSSASLCASPDRMTPDIPVTKSTKALFERSSLMVNKDELNVTESARKSSNPAMANFPTQFFDEMFNPMGTPKKIQLPKKEFINIHVQKMLEETKGKPRIKSARRNGKDIPLKGHPMKPKQPLF